MTMTKNLLLKLLDKISDNMKTVKDKVQSAKICNMLNKVIKGVKEFVKPVKSQ